MSRSPDDWSSSIRATLAVTEPGLSFELGTPERKIVDAVSEALAEASTDQYLIGSLMDIEGKVGLELEQFVATFGYGRLQGKSATGLVRITLDNPMPTDVTLPLGTQFFTKSSLTGGTAPLYFASTQPVVLVAGNLSVDVPVQCTVVGSQGNVAPDSITSVGSVLATSTATNLQAFTGGVDVETDAELRQRFKDTMLRNIAGTEDWYKGLCLQNTKVSRVAVFGPTSLYKTQIEAPSTTQTLSLHQDVKYVWAEMETVFTNLGQEDEIFYTPGDDYTLSSGASPVFTRIETGQITTGDIIDLEFQYTTQSSRNNPATGVTNKVDVFVDGVDPYQVTEMTVVTSTTLSASSSALLYTGNFERVGSAGTPSASHRFTRLASAPIISFPPTITVGATVYTLGTHYHLLRGTTLLRGSHWEVAGIEWEATGPANNTELALTYIYNRTPQLLTAVVNTSKQVTTDVMIHQADWRYIVPCLSIEYHRAYSVSIVNSAITDQLKRFFAAMGFGTQFKLSSLCMVVQQVLGVVDVKITTAEENPTHYGVEVYLDPVDAAPDTQETEDFKANDNVLLVYQEVRITRRATP